jgi:hypothetical protein
MIQAGGMSEITQIGTTGAYNAASADPCGKIRIATYKRNGECSIVEIDGDLTKPQDVRKALDRMDEEYLKQEQNPSSPLLLCKIQTLFGLCR